VFPVVQGVNFFIFLGSLLCFEFFWKQADRWYDSDNRPDGGRGVPASFRWSLGYALFLWAALNLIEIWAVTPDMLVSAAVFLSAGFLIRTVRRRDRTSAVGLGLSLGAGYLAKAPMFPLALVCFVLLALAIREVRAATRLLAPAVAAFVLVAAPLFTAISVKEGHPTFSQVGRFTYLKHVNHIPFPHWREAQAHGLGTPLHPPLLLHASPDVFQYPGPVPGTYPPSFDPDYYTQGLKPRVTVLEQGSAVAFNLAFYFRLFFRAQGVLVGVVLLTAALLWRRSPQRSGDGGWYLAVWAIAAFSMYALVFVTERYVAPFVVLFWAGVLSYWPMNGDLSVGRLSRAAWGVMVFALLVNVAALNLDGLVSIVGIRRPAEGTPPSQFSDGSSVSPAEVATLIRQAGVAEGTDVGIIGYGYTALWAYLAGVRIVAEVGPEDAAEFWNASEETRSAVLAAFRESGASYLVAEITPRGAVRPHGWVPVGETGLWLRSLHPGSTGPGT
jgi:4-amino-4-deoxy-L-arabinose transferase-like glycosyltransferase